MKLTMCPRCRVMHEAVGLGALEGADEERAFRITHCKLCKTPSDEFVPSADAPDTPDGELGFPMAVVPWLSAAGQKQGPSDFPKQSVLSAVSGVQPKIAVRLVNGEFVEGLTEDELFARYDACQDLVAQLKEYCRHKLAKQPETSSRELLPRVRRGVENKGWDLSDAEMVWIMQRLQAVLEAFPD